MCEDLLFNNTLSGSSIFLSFLREPTFCLNVKYTISIRIKLLLKETMVLIKKTSKGVARDTLTVLSHLIVKLKTNMKLKTKINT